MGNSENNQEKPQLYAKKCSVTGKGMNAGYCYMNGEKYFINEKDLIAEIRSRGDEEFNKVSDDYILKEAYDTGEYYYSEWEELDDDENYDYDDMPIS